MHAQFMNNLQLLIMPEFMIPPDLKVITSQAPQLESVENNVLTADHTNN